MDEGGAEAEGGGWRGGVDSHATEPEKSSSCSESSLGALSLAVAAGVSGVE